MLDVSFRVVMEPYDCGVEDNSTWADWVLPIGAIFDDIERIAAECAWQMPLKIYASRRDDARLQTLLWLLAEDHAMDETPWIGVYTQDVE